MGLQLIPWQAFTLLLFFFFVPCPNSILLKSAGLICSVFTLASLSYCLPGSRPKAGSWLLKTPMHLPLDDFS